MYNINKEKFADIVSTLRKEKGLTQKELAAALFVSDKAVSKWETAQSLPDVSLLIPLSEILGITVTELLQGERAESPQPMKADEVENLVKKAVNLVDTGNRNERKPYMVLFVISAAMCLRELYLMRCYISYSSAIMKNTAFLVAMAACFGIYFTFRAQTALPSYYDFNGISSYSHGIFRMNTPGMRLNNSNWPHIVKWLRCWSVATLMTAPAASIVVAYVVEFICVMLSQEYSSLLRRVTTWESIVTAIIYFVYLGAMLLSIYAPGKKYE